MADTRSIWLSADANRLAARNEGTQVVRIEDLYGRPSGNDTASIASPDASFEEVFVRNFPRLRAAVSRRHEAGVAVVAASGTGVHGELWLAAGESLRTGIVGRHGRADLFVPNDAGLSLRHLAVLVDRAGDRTRVRAIDLRSDGGLLDESDRALHAVESDGPLFLTASGLRLFLFPTPSPALWPDDAAAAWAALPARRFLDARPPEDRPAVERAARAARAPARADDRGREVTHVVATAGPVAAEFRSLLAPGESPRGLLHVYSPRFDAEITIGPSAATRGILFGRYERCDVNGLGVMRDNSLSRVHLLLLDVAGTLHAIDTASTNGTTIDGQSVRCEALRADATLRLGNVSLRWDAAS